MSVPASLALVILAVDDLAACADFYQAAFGWERTVQTAVYVEFALPGGVRVGIYQREGFARNTGVAPSRCDEGSTTSTELYLYVAELGAAVATLRGLGARELSPVATRPWGDEAAYFADPAGNVVVVARQL